MGTLIPESTRKAMARIKGLGSVRSFWNVFIDNKARSGSCSAYRRRYMYTSFLISRLRDATFFTTWAKNSETLRPFEIICADSKYNGQNPTLHCSTETDSNEPLHALEFLAILITVKLSPYVLHFVFGRIEKRRSR